MIVVEISASSLSILPSKELIFIYCAKFMMRRRLRGFRSPANIVCQKVANSSGSRRTRQSRSFCKRNNTQKGNCVCQVCSHVFGTLARRLASNATLVVYRLKEFHYQTRKSRPTLHGQEPRSLRCIRHAEKSANVSIALRRGKRRESKLYKCTL